MVLVIMAAALLFALRFPGALVNLLLIGYNGVTQFFPGVVLGLFWRRASREGVLAGLVTGIAIVVILVFGKHDPFLGMNAGFVALLANALVTVLISLAGRKRAEASPGENSASRC
jgi:SSS family solute:Na+ symporter